MTRPAEIVCDALVIGGGAAGVSAAVELARAGLRVELAELRASLGGAYHRQSAGATAAAATRGRRQWSRLTADLSHVGIAPRLRHAFLGIDTDGLGLLDDREAGQVRIVRARALVVATGAVERILPRPGWQLDGVMTAGGLQMLIKETGEAPPGDILIAGNGPLNIALAADLARLGRPPLAVVEAGDPFARPGPALRIAAFPGLIAEASRHLARTVLARTAWLRGSTVAAIERDGSRLAVSVEDRHGGSRRIHADIVALHDGIRPNNFGLPALSNREPIVVRAGDCREVLGIRAAEADGVAAAAEVVAMLSGRASGRASAEVTRQRHAQAVLAELFRPVNDPAGPAGLPDETVLCRCECRTAGDLRALLAGPDPIGMREIKLNGRFGMGVCQGRYCAESVGAFVAAERPDIAAAPLSRDRWPTRPVSISALTGPEETRGE